MKRVMAFGTFDILHPGHLSLFKQARRLGDYLIIVVGRDSFVEKIKNKKPKNNEDSRVKTVRKSNLVDKAILGSKTYNYFQTIRTYRPDIITLGYDQKPSAWKLKKDLGKHRIRGVEIKRLKPYKPEIYKSSKLRK